MRNVVSSLIAISLVATTATLASTTVEKFAADNKFGNEDTESAAVSAEPRYDVAYDATAGLLSITARDAPLGDLLAEIARRAALEITIATTQLGQERVRLNLQSVPVDEALRELLQGFNWVSLRAREGAELHPLSSSPFTRVVVLSKANQEQISFGAGAEPDTAETSGSGDLPAYKDALQAVRSLAAPERAETVDVLVETLEAKEFATLEEAVDLARLLNELDPASSDNLLQAWLGSDDQRLRKAAIASLGQLGGAEAARSLTTLFKGTNVERHIKQMAANSLAQIGSAEAMATLLDAYKTGDNQQRRAAAIAIARSGDTDAQQELADEIGSGRVSEATSTQQVINEFLADEEAKEEARQ